MRPPINLDTFKQAIADADAIPVEAGGKTFVIRPPHLLSDEEFAAFRALGDDDDVAAARIMVDDYDAFAAAGGSAVLVGLIIAQAAEDKQAEQGATPGESGGSSTS